MLAKGEITNEIRNPVAIFDKELRSERFFTIQMFEMCTMCGARFGIGYREAGNNDSQATDETEELPRRLTKILAKDHRQDRAHKRFIDLDI